MASDGDVDANIESSAEQSAADSATQASQSLLSCLGASTAADITRKCNIRANPPHTTIRKKKPACKMNFTVVFMDQMENIITSRHNLSILGLFLSIMSTNLSSDA